MGQRLGTRLSPAEQGGWGQRWEGLPGPDREAAGLARLWVRTLFTDF